MWLVGRILMNCDWVSESHGATSAEPIMDSLLRSQVPRVPLGGGVDHDARLHRITRLLVVVGATLGHVVVRHLHFRGHLT